ncbi:MAG TPA: hypothetical protein VM369_11220, partial [Candidatus Binatia bacterium]|nr:hypothetical protein [Candidatus Binatia bacterium]
MKSLHSKQALVSVLAAAMLSLSACGGGGGGGGGNSVVADKCAAVAGAGDPVQAALVQLSASLTAVPGAGASAASLIGALSKMVDAVDALANVLQAAGVSQDPSQIADAGNSVGDAASCGLDQATVALEALSAQVGAGTPSGLEIDQIEATIADLQAFLATDPFAGGTEPPSLSDVAAEFGTLSDQLDTLVSLLPAELSGRPEARLALAALADGIDRFGVLLVNV